MLSHLHHVCKPFKTGTHPDVTDKLETSQREPARKTGQWWELSEEFWLLAMRLGCMTGVQDEMATEAGGCSYRLDRNVVETR